MEEKGLFVREASGLVKEIGPYTAIFTGLMYISGGGFIWPAQIPTVLFPGCNMLLMYFIWSLIGIQEALTYFFSNVNFPRSGGAYVSIARGYHPFWGLAEGYRAVIQNPMWLGSGGYFAAIGFGSMLKVVSVVAGSPGIAAVGDLFLTNKAVQIGIGFSIILVGIACDALGPAFFKRWIAVGTFLVVGLYAVGWIHAWSTPISALPTRWDETWGPGAYNEIVSVATANGWQPFKWTWEASWNSMLFLWGIEGNPSNIQAIAGEVSQPKLSFAIATLGVVFISTFFNILGGIPLYTKYMTFMTQYVFCWNNNLPMSINPNPLNPPYIPVLYGSLMHRNVPLITAYGSTELIMNFMTAIGSVYWISRPSFAMAFDRFFPETFSKIHPRFHTPINSLWLCLVLGLIWCTFTAYIPVTSVLASGAISQFILLNLNMSLLVFPYFKKEIWQMGLAKELFGIPYETVVALVGVPFWFYFQMLAFRILDLTAVFVTVFYMAFVCIIQVYYYEMAERRKVDLNRLFGMLPPA